MLRRWPYQVSKESSSVDADRVEAPTSSRSLGNISFYGVGAMMRWVHCELHTRNLSPIAFSLIVMTNNGVDATS
jgi:hypothetical protein|eukprot:COSAG02_NODE_155_length_33066_cov_32.167562_18_plen_74_part_00